MEVSGDENEEWSWERRLPVISVGVARIRDFVETDSTPLRVSKRSENELSLWLEISATFVSASSAGPRFLANARTRDSLPWRKVCRVGRSRGPFLDLARRIIPRTMLPVDFSASESWGNALRTLRRSGS